ncbi:hypothetical protein BGW80DRAFT_1267876 [Lactifluus volemus]|nr:hypothetical protein BGW80DRAFT_1381223 [Lactifluus volemus]KAH9981021.1 hypothetical protein BGW80DRAFT_1267876 [Lactifluus volemus]
MQLEEKLDEARVATRDRETEFRAMLEARVTQLVKQANASRTSTTTAKSIADIPPRPDSRASTV